MNNRCDESCNESGKTAVFVFLKTSEKWKDSMVETAENVFTNVCSALGLGW